MTRRRPTREGRVLPTLAAILLLCGVAATWPAAAQDLGPDFNRADSQFGYRHHGDDVDDRRRRVLQGTPDFDRFGAPDRFSDLGWNDPWQSEARERPERAAARLREALVLIRRQSSGPRLDEASEQALQALIRAQNAMTWLPRDPSNTGDDEGQRRHELRSGQGIGAHRASGGWRS